MAGDDLLLVVREERWARLTINRPQASNAANQELWRRIGEEAERLAQDPGVRAIVLTGAGDRAFMAGADLKEFPAVLADRGRIRDYLEAVTRTLDLLEDLDVPVIAEINGPAIGGGLELAVACDYRVAVDTARFGIPSADVGLAITYRDVERIAALVGSGRARELLIFGRVYSAEEALTIGLVNEVVPREKLSARVRELAREVSGKAELSVRSAKKVLKSIAHARDPFREEALRSIQEAWESEEFRRRVERLLSRR